MVLFFSQNWHFFAPNPGFYSDKIWIGCETKKGPLKWHDPTTEILKIDEGRPFSTYGKLSYLHRLVATDLYDAVATQASTACPKLESVDGNSRYELCPKAVELTSQSETYERALRFAKSQCRALSTDKESISKIKILVVRKYPFPYSRRNEYGKRPYFQIQPIEFKKEDV